MNAPPQEPLPPDYVMPDAFDWRALTPEDSPMTPEDLVHDAKHVELSTAEVGVGDMARGFVLPVFDFTGGSPVATGQQLDLLALAQEQPVALVFGSYT